MAALRSIQELQQTSPLYIWAPTARNGVTLLQRLITSSKSVLVFGENTFFALQIPVVIRNYQTHSKEGSESRKRLASGDYSFWSSAAFPHHEQMNAAAVQSFFSFVGAYQFSAESEGFTTWGIKEPSPYWPAVDLISILLPKSRHLVVYRNLRDVLRSYKTRGWLESIDKVRAISDQWQANVRVARTLQTSNRMLVIKYEEFVANPTKGAQLLTGFVGGKPIDPAIFDIRINTFSKAEGGQSETGYEKPRDLTQEEWDVARSVASEVMAEAGYSID